MHSLARTLPSSSTLPSNRAPNKESSKAWHHTMLDRNNVGCENQLPVYVLSAQPNALQSRQPGHKRNVNGKLVHETNIISVKNGHEECQILSSHESAKQFTLRAHACPPDFSIYRKRSSSTAHCLSSFISFLSIFSLHQSTRTSQERMHALPSFFPRSRACRI